MKRLGRAVIEGMAGLVLPVAVGMAAMSPTTAAAANVVNYYQLDAVGNVLVVTDTNGAILEQHDYFPFGEECTTGPCAGNTAVGAGEPKKFTGKERDNETGLDYFGARYYASKIGRFTTVDPVMNIRANLLEPQRWNRYSYATNNPLRYKDPDGQSPTVVTGLIGAAIGGTAGFVGSIGAQFVRDDFSFSNVNFQDAGAAAAGGAVSGGLAGLTLGLSVVAEAGVGGIVAVGALSNVAGGAVTRAVDSSPQMRPSDIKEIGLDAMFGAAGGLVGVQTQGLVSSGVPHLAATQAGMQAAAKGGGAGAFGASRGAAGIAAKIGATRTTAEVAATVAGAKTTNVAVPVGRAVAERNAGKNKDQ